MIRKAEEKDLVGIYELYEEIIKADQEYMTQYLQEISFDYIVDCYEHCQQRGMAFVLEIDQKVKGFLKGYTSEYRCLAHKMDNVTILISNSEQGKGYGPLLMKQFMKQIEAKFHHIRCVDLVTQDRNTAAKSMYNKLGFTMQQSLKGFRVIKHQQLINCCLFSWENASFEKQALKKYEDYLQAMMLKMKEKGEEKLKMYQQKFVKKIQ